MLHTVSGNAIITSISSEMNKTCTTLEDIFWKIPRNGKKTNFITVPGRGEVPSPSNDETPSRENRGGMTPTLRKPTLGQVVGYFKYLSTKKINELTNNALGRLWQRNYYEHIIRNEQDLYNARKYILENPLKWEEDEFYCKQR
jgi:hypothetical protein